jgi:hypothetical protein
VARGTHDLSSLLTSGDSLFSSKNTLLLSAPTTRELLSSVQEAAAHAEETLLLYYAGHGLLSPTGSLLLSTSDTELDHDFTAAPYETIRSLIARSRAKNSIVILDACFSGRALHAMGPLDGLTPIPSTYVIAATGRNQAAFAPSGDQYTAFTGAMMTVLNGGIPGRGEFLTLDDVWEATSALCTERGSPRPQRSSTGGDGAFRPFIRNHAHTEQ